MYIKVKSKPENWQKEHDGRKPNTVRLLDGDDIIEIENTEDHRLTRGIITDITTWKGQIIISFRPIKKR